MTASPGTSVLTVAATDLDTGSFGEVSLGRGTGGMMSYDL